MHADDDRRLMADSLARWLDGRETTPPARLRQGLGAAGWLWPGEDQLLLPRAQHVALVAHAIGQADAPVPYASLVFAATLLAALPVEDGAALQRRLAAGEPAVAVVLQSGAAAVPVIDAIDADTLLVASPAEGWVATAPAGHAALEPVRTLDGHAAALARPLRAGACTVVARGDVAARALALASDHAVLASCGIVAGLLQRLVAQTVLHVNTRRQFGATVGSLQAVQHRAADMHVAAQELRPLLQATAAAMETPARPLAVDLLRVKCGRSARCVAQGAVQLHGAMGLTQELPVGRAVLRVEAELARHRSPSAAAARLQEALLASGPARDFPC